MVWIGCSENIEPTKWGWDLQGDKLDNTPAPDVLLQMIHCNCVGGCNTLRCSCKKYGVVCTAACGSCQNENCENMNNAPIVDKNEDGD